MARPGRGPRGADRRARWRLAAVIAVPTVIAAVLGALQISSDAGSYAASGRDQHLARLDAAVVMLTRDLEDERDLSAAYAARRQAGPVLSALPRARAATDAAARTVRADAAGVGAGYQPATVQDLDALLAGITDLRNIRVGVRPRPAGVAVIKLYSADVIGPAEHVQRRGRRRHRRHALAGHRRHPRRAAPGGERPVGAAGHLVRRAERATARARGPMT